MRSLDVARRILGTHEAACQTARGTAYTAAERRQPVALDIGSESSVRDPAGFFAAAREAGDVQWSDVHRAWVVLSHAEVEAAFKDEARISADRSEVFARLGQQRTPAFAQVIELLGGFMNFRDAPAHTRLREPVRTAFTPRNVANLGTEIQAIVDSVIADFPGDQVDLNEHFARVVPVLVIAAVLGVDPSERNRLLEWSDDIARLVFSLSPEKVDEGPLVSATTELTTFFSELIDRELAGEDSGTILARIARFEGMPLSRMELVGACTIVLFGGHETTTTLLTNALGILLERPELAAWLRAHPEHDETAFDEFMRVAGPARSMPRKVRVDHERGGQQLRAGDTVYLCMTAANHDPAVFENPGTIDFTRDPNPHLGFGWGPHYCLGANLARLEGRIALRTLLDRFPDMEAAGEIPQVRASAMGFGRRPIPVRLQR